jgi:hypothetical protein
MSLSHQPWLKIIIIIIIDTNQPDVLSFYSFEIKVSFFIYSSIQILSIKVLNASLASLCSTPFASLITWQTLHFLQVFNTILMSLTTIESSSTNFSCTPRSRHSSSACKAATCKAATASVVAGSYMALRLLVLSHLGLSPSTALSLGANAASQFGYSHFTLISALELIILKKINK